MMDREMFDQIIASFVVSGAVFGFAAAIAAII